MNVLDPVKNVVRSGMRQLAEGLNHVSGGKLTPNMVTIAGLIAHIPIAWLIYKGYLVAAGLWLIIFGLFDALDGELARLQKRSSPAGMFLDSVTDRIKEVVIYMGIGTHLYLLSRTYCSPAPENCTYYLHRLDIGGHIIFAIVIAVLGMSLITSYINAWGEAVLARAGSKSSAINKVFRGGLASFEIRMTIIVIGLLTNQLFIAVCVIGILAFITIVTRLNRVLKALTHTVPHV